MEMLSLKECQQAMAALDAADKLNASVENELSQFKNMDTNAIIKRASKMHSHTPTQGVSALCLFLGLYPTYSH
ncbi:hypothetical protein ABJZ12_22455, partial [Vibrio parahaemolyticus]